MGETGQAMTSFSAQFCKSLKPKEMLPKTQKFTTQQSTVTSSEPFLQRASGGRKTGFTRLELIVLVALVATLAACTKTYPLVTQYIPLVKPVVVIPAPQVAVKEQSAPGSCYGNTVFYRQYGKVYWVKTVPQGHTEEGIASWYGGKFHGRLTANEERYNMFGMTAAHKTLPLGVMVRVINLDNNKHVLVRINDRGPFKGNRIIDLSYGAAKKIAMVKSGLAPVRIIVEQVPYRNRLEGPDSLFGTDQVAVAR